MNKERLTSKGENRSTSVPHLPPFDAVAYLQFFHERQLISRGTGFLVKHGRSKFIVTSAHTFFGPLDDQNVTFNDQDVEADRVQIKFGFDNGYEPYDSFAKNKENNEFEFSFAYLTCDKEPNPYDYGVIKLTDSDQANLPEVFFSFSGADSDLTKKKLNMKGYPGYLYKKNDSEYPWNNSIDGVQYQTGVKLEDSQNSDILCYKDATSRGNSGSPIYYEDNGKYVAVSIHSTGREEMDMNFGVRITGRVREELLKMSTVGPPSIDQFQRRVKKRSFSEESNTTPYPLPQKKEKSSFDQDAV